MNYEFIGLRFKKLREQTEVSIQDLALWFNIEQDKIQRWEDGTEMPDIKLLIEMLEKMGIDYNLLFIPDSSEKTTLMNQEFRGKYRSVFITIVVVWMIMAGPIVGVLPYMLFKHIGGGVSETFLYPIYLGIVLLAGIIVFCTCLIINAISDNFKHYIK